MIVTLFIDIDNKEPSIVAAAMYQVAEMLYAGKEEFKIRSANLPVGDIHIYRGDDHLWGENKTVDDILLSRGKRFHDQKQRLSNVEAPTIYVIRGWWGNPNFKCDNCGHTNIYSLCPSCKRPNKFRQSTLRQQDSKSIATMMVELMKIGIPTFSVPDEIMMAYTYFQYFELKGDRIKRYKIVADVNKKTELTYRVVLQATGIGEKHAYLIAKGVNCPADLNPLTPLQISNLVRVGKGEEPSTAILKVADSFYKQWHGIDD